MTVPMTAAQELELQLRLACAELRDRLRAGEPARAESILAKFGGLANHADSALELIYTEWLTREELEQAPAAEEFFERFPQWRERLRRLLEVHDALRHRSSLDTVTGVGQRDGPDGGRPKPPRVGPYEILGELGRGGMGVVYRARHVSLNRLVALKRIRRGEFAEPAELARFHTEAQTAASLHHPNIVQIYDVGDHDGLPYLAMELVNGPSLAERLTQGPLPPRAAAALVETLARAMHHAHERGVIHRDLKPPNILLQDARDQETRRRGDTGTGSAKEDTPISLSPGLPVSLSDWLPKITDFGLAKQLDSAVGLTGSGALMGTPSYMAPEQLDPGKQTVGPRADVYALGAVLYESLTGRPPFLGDSPIATVDQVRRLEPASIRSMQPQCPRDLETICLKCLQKEPGQRYQSAAALADDLHRLLEGKPVHARPVGPLGRVLRWSRRKPVVAGLLAALVLSVAVGGAGIAWQWSRGREREADVQKALGRAEAGYDKARESIDRMAQFADELSRRPRATLQGQAGLQEALAAYQVLLQEKGADPLVRQRTVKIHLRIGELHEWLGQRREAAEHYETAKQLLDGLQAAHPGDLEVRRLMARYFHQEGQLLQSGFYTPKLEQAEAAFRKSVELGEQLCAADPKNSNDAVELTESLLALAEVLAQPQRRQESEQLRGRALEILQPLHEASPRSPKYLKHMALCLTNIGRAHRNAKKPLEAEDYFNRALRLRQEWSELEPDNPSARSDLAAAHMLLATLLKTTSRRELAESCYLASIREREQLIQDFPRTVDYRVGLAFALRSLSDFQRLSGRALDAEQSARRGIDVAMVALAEAPTAANARWILATNHQLAALALEKQDRPHAALVEFQASVDVFQKLAADFPEESNYGGNAGWRAYDLARLWRGLGQAREAEQTLRQSLACFEKLMAEHGHDPVHGRDFVTVSGTLADVLIAGARPAEAETVLTRARTIAAQLASETKAPAYQKLLAGVHSHLGSFFAKTARYAEAAEAYRSALGAVPKDNAARQQLAWLLATCPVTELRDPATAVRLAREAVAAQPKSGRPWTTLGAAQYRNGDWADAVKSLNESVRLHKDGAGEDWFFLAMAHWRQGDQKAARAAFGKAIEWMQKNDPDSAELQRFRTEAADLLGME